uniref:Uncharacterized protein n=1 Tax=Arundo donax TaxID=35708 RepID=A0A0A9EHS2_ARUDO
MAISSLGCREFRSSPFRCLHHHKAHANATTITT